MPEKINFKVGIPGNMKREKIVTFTFKHFLDWMAQQRYTEEVKQKLIEKAKCYPVGALPNFIDTIQNHLKDIYHG